MRTFIRSRHRRSTVRAVLGAAFTTLLTAAVAAVPAPASAVGTNPVAVYECMKHTNSYSDPDNAYYTAYSWSDLLHPLGPRRGDSQMFMECRDLSVGIFEGIRPIGAHPGAGYQIRSARSGDIEWTGRTPRLDVAAYYDRANPRALGVYSSHQILKAQVIDFNYATGESVYVRDLHLRQVQARYFVGAAPGECDGEIC